MNNKKRKSRIWCYCITSVLALITSLNIENHLNNMIYAMTKSTTKSKLEILVKSKAIDKPQIEVPVDLEIEKADQKSVDSGHSPWRLDPVYVSQVFVSLKISPEGIKGDYPINYENLNLIKNTKEEAIVEVDSENSPIKRVYLKRLIRQDDTGIWTVIGYDPIK